MFLYGIFLLKTGHAMKSELSKEQRVKVQELKKMSPQQWDSICKQCGICCLEKVNFKDRKDIVFYTDVCCEKFNTTTKKCNVYNDRFKIKGCGCKKVNLDVVLNKHLLPRTCGYVEYIFGPAPSKICVDWQKIIPANKANLSSTVGVLDHIILGSEKWNTR